MGDWQKKGDEGVGEGGVESSEWWGASRGAVTGTLEGDEGLGDGAGRLLWSGLGFEGGRASRGAMTGTLEDEEEDEEEEEEEEEEEDGTRGGIGV